MFDGICDALFHELETYDNKLMGGKAPMTSQDLDGINKIAHALKSLKSYEVMAEGYDNRRSRTRYDDYRRY